MAGATSGSYLTNSRALPRMWACWGAGIGEPGTSRSRGRKVARPLAERFKCSMAFWASCQVRVMIFCNAPPSATSIARSSRAGTYSCEATEPRIPSSSWAWDACKTERPAAGNPAPSFRIPCNSSRRVCMRSTVRSVCCRASSSSRRVSFSALILAVWAAIPAWASAICVL